MQQDHSYQCEELNQAQMKKMAKNIKHFAWDKLK